MYTKDLTNINHITLAPGEDTWQLVVANKQVYKSCIYVRNSGAQNVLLGYTPAFTEGEDNVLIVPPGEVRLFLMNPKIVSDHIYISGDSIVEIDATSKPVNFPEASQSVYSFAQDYGYLGTVEQLGEAIAQITPDNKLDKIIPTYENTIPAIDADGNLVDSELTLNDISGLVESVDDLLEDFENLDISAILSEHNTDADAHSSEFGAKLDKTGGTMTGPIVLSEDPALDSHAVNKKYVDDSIKEVESIDDDPDNEILLENNTTYIRRDPVEEITLPIIEYIDGYISVLMFLSGSTPTTIIDESEALWTGDGVIEVDDTSVFVPEANKRYVITFTFDGANIRAFSWGE